MSTRQIVTAHGGRARSAKLFVPVATKENIAHVMCNAHRLSEKVRANLVEWSKSVSLLTVWTARPGLHENQGWGGSPTPPRMALCPSQSRPIPNKVSGRRSIQSVKIGAPISTRVAKAPARSMKTRIVKQMRGSVKRRGASLLKKCATSSLSHHNQTIKISP